MSLCHRQGFLDIKSCYDGSVIMLPPSPKITSPFYEGSDKAVRQKKRINYQFSNMEGM